ncbi:efflux RND transporter periplasmic adaptor subunit [Paraglaciecola agarilytica]|jgi:RND family efflux transporter MFP subunit|nr:efflux RND transporter periplasmic adaptor subunit [Paraglaciecola agarilytica]|tara:strand:- start:2580 stop:3611 length:1032 start_codon:yes stop_codon:yes gene_type:complete
MASKLSTMILLFLISNSPVMGAERPSAAVVTASIVSIDMSEHVVAYGALQPRPDKVQTLSVSSSGIVGQVWIQIGQRVKKGQRLAEIILSPEAKMQYLQATNAVEYALQQLKRSKRMFEEKLATMADVENATKNLNDSQSTLNALLERNSAQPQETIFSPIDGIVTQLNLVRGQRVQSNDNAILIASENHIVARVGIEPEDVNRLKSNTSVIITPVFNDSVHVSSSISVINGMVNPSTRLVDALIDIPLSHAKNLVLGTPIVANFSLENYTSLAVPNSAILNDANGYFIFTLKDQIAHKIYVIKGSEEGKLVAISGDIHAGEKVVVLGNYILKEGMLTREEKL